MKLVVCIILLLAASEARLLSSRRQLLTVPHEHPEEPLPPTFIGPVRPSDPSPDLSLSISSHANDPSETSPSDEACCDPTVRPSTTQCSATDIQVTTDPRSMALSNDGHILVVGDPTGGGRIDTYTWNGSDWESIGEAIPGNPETFPNLGLAVALSDDGRALVATGSILSFVYRWEGGSWVQWGHPLIGAEAAAISHGFVALGTASKGDADPGHVRVFQNDGARWIQLGEDFFGVGSFALKGDRLIIGLPHHTDPIPHQGMACVFQWFGGAWIEIGNAILGDREGEQLGTSVDMSGDRIVVGGIGRSGVPAARVLSLDASGIWVQDGLAVFGSKSLGASLVSVSFADDGYHVTLVSSTPSMPAHVISYGFGDAGWYQTSETIADDACVAISGNGKTLAVRQAQVDSAESVVRVFSCNESGLLSLVDKWTSICKSIEGDPH